MLLDSLSNLNALLPKFEHLLGGTEIPSKLLHLRDQMEDHLKQGIDEFRDHIILQGTQTKHGPSNGTIHSLTVDCFKFLRALAEFQEDEVEERKMDLSWVDLHGSGRVFLKEEEKEEPLIPTSVPRGSDFHFPQRMQRSQSFGMDPPLTVTSKQRRNSQKFFHTPKKSLPPTLEERKADGGDGGDAERPPPRRRRSSVFRNLFGSPKPSADTAGDSAGSAENTAEAAEDSRDVQETPAGERKRRNSSFLRTRSRQNSFVFASPMTSAMPTVDAAELWPELPENTSEIAWDPKNHQRIRANPYQLRRWNSPSSRSALHPSLIISSSSFPFLLFSAFMWFSSGGFGCVGKSFTELLQTSQSQSCLTSPFVVSPPSWRFNFHLCISFFFFLFRHPQDASLAAVFLMNNYDYIIRQIR